MVRQGAVKALFTAALSEDETRSAHATTAVANLSEMLQEETQQRIIEDGAIETLSRLATSKVAFPHCYSCEPLPRGWF